MANESGRTAACPSCGAPLRFRGATSVVAVCAFCRATLVREGANLQDIGKQAELLEDHSPLQLHASGKHRGESFDVVGRIQYRYGAGAWNEWYVLFGDRKGAWLSDASREYTITYPRPPEVVPAFGELAPGQRLALSSETFTVTNLEAAEVVAGEGELPFRFQSGWKADVADLRGARNRFATIDYSDVPPRIYTGERLPFEAFSFSNLRDPERIGFVQGRALSFKCAGCGAPLEKHLARTEVVACGSCGTVNEPAEGVGGIVQRNEKNEAAFAPRIALGTAGTWQGVRYELVGAMKRGITVEGELYEWTEYLLHDVEQGYAWITEYDGHYNFVRAAAEIPREDTSFMGAVRRVHYLGRPFKLFQSAQAKVTRLAGEFYWRVKLGDEAQVDDYVAPPLVLSREKTGNEVSWSLGEYVEPAALWKAFSLPGKPPPPTGIAPNQPSPHAGKVLPLWKLLGFLLLAAFAMQVAFGVLGFVADPSTKVPFAVEEGKSASTVSAPFRIGSVLPGPVVLRIESTAQKSWVQLTLKLVEADTGQAYGLTRQVGYTMAGGQRQGWPSDVAEIPSVPPGRYTLAVDAKAGPPPGNDWPGQVTGHVEVRNASLDWGNFWLLAVFLLLWPVAATWKSVSFETRRWAESDIGATVKSAAASGGDGDDSDD